MELQFYGANCIAITYKGARIVIDDNLLELGAKSITKPEDVALFTTKAHDVNARLIFDGPGEYEVSDVSITGISAQEHIEGSDSLKATMYKLIAGDQSVLITGHINPKLDEKQLEAIGIVDVLVVPVGGNGYTIDPNGALQVIKEIDPKIVIPTHYDDKALKYPVPQQDLSHALKEMAMVPKENITKLKLKNSELSEITHLIVLEKS